MTPQYHFQHTIPAALTLLPSVMDSKEARVMLLAIGLQESRFKHRVQVGGPARGFWQFEQFGGVAGVLSHIASRWHAVRVCQSLEYDANTGTVYSVLAHNDTLACAFARLLLWTLPGPLVIGDEDIAWSQYIQGWRPGKPHRETWGAFLGQARDVVEVL